MKKRILFISSSGGHFEQLMMLKPLIDNNISMIVTEKTKYSSKSTKKNKKLFQVNRTEKLFVFKMLLNTLLSVYYLLIFRPAVVISTGTLCSIPLCLIARLTRTKVVYIESFAKVSSPTKTGKFLYRKVDIFIVQWEELLTIYPDAIFIGGIY